MMKKRIIILAVLVVLLIGGVVAGVYASGNSAKDNNKDNESKTTAKKTTSTPKKTTDTEKKETTTKDSVTDDKGVVTKGSSDVEKNAPAKSNSSATDKSSSPATPAFSLSTSGFKTSNVSSVLGGTVTTTYLSSSPSFEKIFENLTIEVNQYKVEHVVGANKAVSASNPESYLANKNGYVITLDISVKNTSSKDKMYKADQITLIGANEFVGGSLDNFVPSNFHLIGSKADPNIFTAGKTARGLLTFTMTESVYNDLAADSKIGVPNPDKFDASVSEAKAGDDVIAAFPVK
ncbi:DUF5068 domain-containing protein [Listeria monocytogenes]|uniref:DUF5068 domain-containing protein n=3 Tax=Listeria monocytogenes TaxID=1639 RepID=A0A5Y1MS92_LISMN|nr:conserved hypothetical protein [Listeria monocytogenes HCC23]AEH92099.1 hypothetical protein LMM7_1094 [Listeria monocytogenes M7]EAC2403578.1 DUF5068 domain-containing protein [Listeria monocytogenes]EAF4456842.1 DUF5068 domain-containing protein [Listeria monocytogenes serotype 1/2a]MCY60930.1 DUF5068 domain-containing protein [Listeria monocytogenes serotype 4c]MDA20330.1 DUF5068 domain-containing protein [Listeria monocytogenes serotype 4a]CAR83777.1 secreted protein, putative [Listeri